MKMFGELYTVITVLFMNKRAGWLRRSRWKEDKKEDTNLQLFYFQV
jgi:hypothetical protein